MYRRLRLVFIFLPKTVDAISCFGVPLASLLASFVFDHVEHVAVDRFCISSLFFCLLFLFIVFRGKVLEGYHECKEEKMLFYIIVLHLD